MKTRDDRIKIFREYYHYTVNINGKFYCTSDTYEEAVREVEEYKNERRSK